MKYSNNGIYVATFVYAVVFFLYPNSLIGEVLRNELKYLGVVLVLLIIVSELYKLRYGKKD